MRVPLSAWLPGSLSVLQDVLRERAAQVARYGLNEDVEDGTGPATRWLLPFTSGSASDIEAELRSDYEEFVEETGLPTWVHLLREELAEAFQEKDDVRLREELIQVVALGVSWIERIDARTDRTNTTRRACDAVIAKLTALKGN